LYDLRRAHSAEQEAMTPNEQVIGAPYTVHQYHQHVAICDKRGYAVAEIAYGTGGMPDVYRALEYACAWRDRLNATPDETTAQPSKVTVLVADYGHEGHSVQGVYIDKTAAEIARKTCSWEPDDWRFEEYEITGSTVEPTAMEARHDKFMADIGYAPEKASGDDGCICPRQDESGDIIYTHVACPIHGVNGAGDV
jgi:hypothetical protein